MDDRATRVTALHCCDRRNQQEKRERHRTLQVLQQSECDQRESSGEQQRTYGNWRLGRGAGLFGLGPVGTIAAFLVMVLAAAMLPISVLAALVTALVGVLVLAPLAIRINGRTGFQVITARIAWWLARSRRQHV